MVTARWHRASSSSVRPVSSLPKSTATVPCAMEAILWPSCSGKRVKYLRFLPRRRVVPATSTASPHRVRQVGVDDGVVQDVGSVVRQGARLPRIDEGTPGTIARDVRPMHFIARQAAPTLRGSRGRTRTIRTSRLLICPSE